MEKNNALKPTPAELKAYSTTEKILILFLVSQELHVCSYRLVSFFKRTVHGGNNNICLQMSSLKASCIWKPRAEKSIFIKLLEALAFNHTSRDFTSSTLMYA